MPTRVVPDLWLERWQKFSDKQAVWQPGSQFYDSSLSFLASIFDSVLLWQPSQLGDLDWQLFDADKMSNLQVLLDCPQIDIYLGLDRYRSESEAAWRNTKRVRSVLAYLQPDLAQDFWLIYVDMALPDTNLWEYSPSWPQRKTGFFHNPLLLAGAMAYQALAGLATQYEQLSVNQKLFVSENFKQTVDYFKLTHILDL